MELTLLERLHDLVGDTPDAIQRDGAAVALLRLLQAPYFEGGHDEHWHLIEHQGALTIGQQIRDNWYDRHPCRLYTGNGHAIYKTTQINPDDLPPSTHAAADVLLQLFSERDPALWQRLMRPTKAKLAERHNILYTLVDTDELDTQLRSLLGRLYPLDGSLSLQGIEYHSAPNFNDRNMRYVIAHNGRELVGILGLSHYRDWTYGVNYLSVVPGFRKQGIGQGLFAKAIEACVQDGKVLVRTSPSEFAEARPAIPERFDRMSREAPILHVQSNTYLMGLLGKALQRYPMSTLYPHFKPICDRYDRGCERGFANDLAAQREAQEVLDLLDRKNTPSKKTRP